MGDRTVESVLSVVSMDSAALWVRDEEFGPLRLLSECGTAPERITGLSAAQIDNLDALAGDLSSCYSAGGVLALAFGPTQVLRDRGAASMFLSAVRDGSRRIGLLCTVGGPHANVEPGAVEAIELLCINAGSRLASLASEKQLQDMSFRGQLTGVGAVPG